MKFFIVILQSAKRSAEKTEKEKNAEQAKRKKMFLENTALFGEDKSVDVTSNNASEKDTSVHNWKEKYVVLNIEYKKRLTRISELTKEKEELQKKMDKIEMEQKGHRNEEKFDELQGKCAGLCRRIEELEAENVKLGKQIVDKTQENDELKSLNLQLQKKFVDSGKFFL